MSVQLLWELHALFSEGVYKPLILLIKVGEKSKMNMTEQSICKLTLAIWGTVLPIETHEYPVN